MMAELLDLGSALGYAPASSGADLGSALGYGPSAPSDGFQPTQYGFKVRPLDLGNGKQTVQREDGAAYFGPEQGNKGQAGWFDTQGNRVADTLAPKPGWDHPWARVKADLSESNRAAINDLSAKYEERQSKPWYGQIVPPQFAGMTKGLLDAGLRPARFVSRMAGSQALDAPVDTLQRYYDQNFIPSPAGEMVGQALPFLATAGGSAAAQAPAQALTTAQKVKAALAGITKASAIGGTAATSLAQHPEGQSNEDFNKQALEDLKTGAVVGGGLAGAGQVVGGIASKLRAPLNPEAQAIQDLGDKFGVRALAPDLAPPGQMAKLGVLAESVPGSGMVNQRLAQQAEAQAAAQKLLDQHGISGDTSVQIQQGLKNQLATSKGNAKVAYDLVGKLAEDKGTVPLDEALAAIQKFKAQEASAVVPDQGLVGLLDKMETRIKAGRAGEFVPPQKSPVFNEWFKGSQAVDQAGEPLVVYHGTGKTFKDFSSAKMGSHSGLPEARQGIWFTDNPDVASWYAEASPKGAQVRPSYVNLKNPLVVNNDMTGLNAFKAAKAAGNDGIIFRNANEGAAIGDTYVVFKPEQIKSSTSGWWSTPTKEAPGVDLSYSGVRGLRSDLGSMISDYYKGTNAATGSKGVQVLQGVKGAIENDLSNFTSKNGPELEQAAKQADSIYKNQVVPFKDRALAQAVKSSEPDQIYRTFIQQGKGDRAQKFYNALDADGQAAVRSQMVQDAMAKATDGAQPFSPAKFAQSLEKIKDSTGVFFKGQDKFELDGFTNLMRHIQRAGQVGENPTNGQRMVQALILGEGGGAVLGAMGGHPAALVPAVASVASANALTRVFASPAGKRLLLSASALKPGSPAMTKLIEQDLPKILAMETPKNITTLRPQLPAATDTGNPDTVAQHGRFETAPPEIP